MSDMSIVSFERRHRNHYRQQNDNSSKKTVAGGIALGGGIAGRKFLKSGITADQVAIAMHKAELALDVKKLNVLKSVNGALAKDGSKLTEAQTKALAKVGIDLSQAGDNVKDYLKQAQATLAESLDGQNAKTIKAKLSALTSHKKIAKNAEDAQPGKFAEKVLEASKRRIAKLFNMEVDKQGNPVKDFNVDELFEATKKQGQELSAKLIALKKNAEEKLKNIKLLDSEDVVTKAYKSIKNNKMAWGIGSIAAAAIALMYIFKGGKND